MPRLISSGNDETTDIPDPLYSPNFRNHPQLVPLDLREGDHPRVFRDVEPLVEDVHDLVDVHVAQAVLGAVLHEAATGVDHKDALAGLGVLLVYDHDAGGDAGAVEEVGGQADDALDVALAHEGAADVGLSVAAKQHACGRMQAPLPVLLRERTMCSR